MGVDIGIPSMARGKWGRGPADMPVPGRRVDVKAAARSVRRQATGSAISISGMFTILNLGFLVVYGLMISLDAPARFAVIMSLVLSFDETMLKGKCFNPSCDRISLSNSSPPTGATKR